MPIDEKKMKALIKQYGAKKGKDIYYALEQKSKKKSKVKKAHGMCGGKPMTKKAK